MGTITVGQLQKLHAEHFGPTTSRNKPFLLRKLAPYLDGAPSAPVVSPATAPAAPPTVEQEVRRLIGSGVSLRVTCQTLTAGGFQTPTGGKVWWPSSVQCVMRKLGLKHVAGTKGAGRRRSGGGGASDQNDRCGGMAVRP